MWCSCINASAFAIWRHTSSSDASSKMRGAVGSVADAPHAEDAADTDADAVGATLPRAGDMSPRAVDEDAPEFLLCAFANALFAVGRGRICAARLPPAHSSV